jgi:hypothetical protein
MPIKQISVFLENTSGRLGEVTGILAKAQINIRAISIADTAEFGILRLIVNDQEAALNCLNANGFTTRVTDVVVVEIEDKPGSLAKVMELFQTSKVNIEYLYASLEGETGKAVVIFKLENHKQGLQIIKENNLSTLERF